MSDRSRARRELAALLEADLKTSGAKTATEMKHAAYESLRTLTVPDGDDPPPMVEIVRNGDRFRVRLHWADGSD